MITLGRTPSHPSFNQYKYVQLVQIVISIKISIVNTEYKNILAVNMFKFSLKMAWTGERVPRSSEAPEEAHLPGLGNPPFLFCTVGIVTRPG